MEQMKAATDHGFLYRLSKDGVDSYLFGTIHLANLESSLPGPAMIRALGDTDVVVLELNPLVLKPDDVQRSLAKHALTPDAATRAKVEAFAAAECMSVDELKATPFAMQPTSILLRRAQRLGLFAQYGLDGMLAGMAMGMQKPVDSLETLDEQFDALFGTTDAEVQAHVADAIASLDGPAAMNTLRAMFGTWTERDLKGFERALSEDEAKDSEQAKAFRKRLLGDRNRSMAKKITQWHGRRRLFVAVGSAHLVGEDGLPALLNHAGFVVQWIRPPDPKPQP